MLMTSSLQLLTSILILYSFISIRIFTTINNKIKALSKSNFENIREEKKDIANSNFSRIVKKYFTISYFYIISKKFKSITRKFDFNIAYKPMNCMNNFIKTGKNKIKKKNILMFIKLIIMLAIILM